jgi:hypothetical protein
LRGFAAADEPHLGPISVPGFICTLAKEVLDPTKVTGGLGISEKTGESFYQKERRRLVPIDPRVLNLPATFGWLDLQEVSQSCPAETLF